MPCADVCYVFLLVGVELAEEVAERACVGVDKSKVGVAAVLGAVEGLGEDRQQGLDVVFLSWRGKVFSIGKSALQYDRFVYIP
jgi:hypothetical protein